MIHQTTHDLAALFARHQSRAALLGSRRSPAVKEAMARARAEEGYNPEMTKGEVEMHDHEGPGSNAAEPVGVEVARN